MLLRSLLFVPGNKPKLLTKAPTLPVDAIIYDLEDSVPLSEKQIARKMVAGALDGLKDSHVEGYIRINASEALYREDLAKAFTEKTAGVCFPKVECAEQVRILDTHMLKLEQNLNLAVGSIKIIVMLESARGILNAYEVALSSRRIYALTFGAEDLTYNLRTTRTRDGDELFFARCKIIYAASAAGLFAFDTIYADIGDPEGFLSEAERVKKMGFSGKLLIHPSQVEPANKLFSPTKQEYKEALAIVGAFKEAHNRGEGVIAFKGKMVDLPVVERARQTLELMAMIKAKND